MKNLNLEELRKKCKKGKVIKLNYKKLKADRCMLILKS